MSPYWDGYRWIFPRPRQQLYVRTDLGQMACRGIKGDLGARLMLFLLPIFVVAAILAVVVPSIVIAVAL